MTSWVVVTGSSSGIGRATALRLAKAGWKVMVHFHSQMELATAVVEEIRSIGGIAGMFQADFGESTLIAKVVEDCWHRTGGFSGWVHCAGVDTLTSQAAKLPFEAKLELLTKVDLWGTILAGRSAGRWMHQAGNGCIITIGWDQAETGMEGESGELFGAMKAGIMGFTRSLAKSLAPKVRVNCVAPGWIKTAWGESASSIWQNRVLAETPLKRWGEPTDVASAVEFLLSPAASFLTGQTLAVNGGVVMK